MAAGLRCGVSARLFGVLVVHLLGMALQTYIGLTRNSLGLLADSGHMAVDAMALVMSVVMREMTHRRASRDCPFGWAALDAVGGIVNGVFLLCVSVAVFVSAADRLAVGAEVAADGLLETAWVGLAINALAAVVLHDTDAGHGHSHGHGHHHGHQHGHHHGHHEAGKSKLIHGVFLHVLADLGGSAAVIISSSLVRAFGWSWADAMVSLLLSGLIWWSAWPLVTGSAHAVMDWRRPRAAIRRHDDGSARHHMEV